MIAKKTVKCFVIAMIPTAYLLRSILVMGLTFGFTNLAEGLSVAAEKTSKKTKVESFARYGFEPEIPGLQADGKVLLDNVVTRFGPPLKTSTEVGQDRDDPSVKSEMTTLEYLGLIIKLWRNDRAPKGQYELSTIMLTSPQYQLKYGLRIGQPKAAFLKVLGAPNHPESPKNYKDEGQPLYYAVGTDPDEKVHVGILFDHNNIATQISWYPPPLL